MKAGEGARGVVWKKGEERESRKQMEEGKGKWDKEAEEEKLRELEMI